MNGNIVEFPVDGDLYRELALKKAENEDLLGALVLYRKAKQLQPNNPFIDLDLAEVYSQMHMYDHAAAHLFCVLNSENASAIQDAIPFLAETFIYAGDYTAGSYYMQRVLVECDGEEPAYSGEFLDYLQQLSEENPGFRLVYPPESVDYGVSLEEGRRLMKMGQNAQALEVLLQIPSVSKDYVEALCNIALAYFLSDDHAAAEQAARTALNLQPDNVFALTTLVTVLTVEGKGTEAAPYLNLLRAVETEDPDELLKLATAFCEAGDHKNAQRTLLHLCELCPYNLTALYLSAVASYNVGSYKEAKKAIVAFFALSPNNPVALSLWNIVTRAENRVANGKKPALKGPLPYVFSLTEEGIGEYLKNFTAFLRYSKAKKREVLSDEERRAKTVGWVFYTESSELKEEAIRAVAETNTKAGFSYLESLLSHPSVSLSVKQEILRRLLLCGTRKKVGVSIYNILARMPLRPLETEGDKAELLACAYARAVSVLVLSEDAATLCDRLLSAAETLYYYLQMSAKLDVLERYDEGVIAAHLYTVGEFKNKHGARMLGKLFSVNPEKIRSLWEEIL